MSLPAPQTCQIFSYPSGLDLQDTVPYALLHQRRQLTLTDHMKHRIIGRYRVPLVGALKVVYVPGVSSVERQCVVQQRLVTARLVGAYL